jgi:CheY-like chemotaxis protein
MEVPSARRNLNGVRILTLIADEEVAARVSRYLQGWGVVEAATSRPPDALSKLNSTAMLGESWGYQLALVDGSGIEHELPDLLAEIRGIDALKNIHIVVSVRSEALAHKLKRDFGVLVLTDALRPEPLRRMLHRLFDVESRHFGNVDLRVDEVYDDLNVSAESATLDQPPPVISRGEFSGQVLLVEDNPVNLSVIRKALSNLGLQCETAGDGREALRRFQEQRFDLIFMDCQMPVMDGYEATRLIRRLEDVDDRAPTGIVAMTANAMTGDREKCIAAGMDDYLAKPVGLEQLRECVSGWLSESAASYRLAEREAGAAVSRDRDLTPILDEKVLLELREIMDGDYLNLLGTYLRSAPQLLAQVRAAITQADVEAMVLPVHSLKSSSANVGAMQLSERARETERLARAGKLSEAEAAFTAVDAAFTAAEAALREHVANYSTA